MVGADVGSDQPITEWLVEDIDLMLELLPIVEKPGFQAHSWPDPPVTSDADGKRIYRMPYPNYHEAVERFRTLVYSTSAAIDPYAALPEDPTQDGVPFSVAGTHYPLEYFENATLNQIRRYLVLCTRGERFCDGHIASQFDSGAFQAALRRLRDLRLSLY